MTADSRTVSAQHADGGVTCKLCASQLRNLSLLRVVTFQRCLKTKQMWEQWVTMANTVCETSCFAGSETVCSDENGSGTLASTLECFDENPHRSRAHLRVQRHSCIVFGHYRCKLRTHHMHDVGEHSNIRQCMVTDGTARSTLASKFSHRPRKQVAICVSRETYLLR